MTRQLDPVAKRLAAAGNENAASVLDWLGGQQQRHAMFRRATWCSLGGWGMMTISAIISSGVAVLLSRDARQLFDQRLMSSTSLPWSMTYLPIVLLLVAAFLLIGGILGLIFGRIPGLSPTHSAIDWSAGSDAMTRLLAVGCTYPEAFRTAAQISRTRSSRRWLTSAAQRVERGGAEVVVSEFARGDSAIVELLLEAGDGEPARRWQMAADHFFEVAQRRLILLLGSLPILATIVSGLLVWISISATLGWMWKAVANLIEGLR